MKDRRILRRLWQPRTELGEQWHARNAPFHVMVTGYSVFVQVSGPARGQSCFCSFICGFRSQDAPYFNDIAWQYLVLDEAQAIKNAQSIRWYVFPQLSQDTNALLFQWFFVGCLP